MDTVLVLAWLVLAHLVADFGLQNDWIAMNKGKGGRLGWAALGSHGLHVALCLLPAVFAFGLPGLVYLVVVAASHVGVDRWKVAATRRAEVAALDAARRYQATGAPVPAPALGDAWTPWPGILFLADQFLHLTIAIVAWLVILAGASLLPAFVDVVNAILRDWDRATVHAVVLTAVVLVSLFLVNTRGAYYFLFALASPRLVPPTQGAAAPSEASSPVPVGAAGRISATIAAFERILIVGFVLTGTQLLVGVLVAIDAFVRRRQLEDRGFADWYLLTTAGGLFVALSTGFIAAAALSTLGG